MTNILYIDQTNRLEESYMYPYYGAVYRELKRMENVYFFGGFVSDINGILSHYDVSFDCIVFGLGFFAQGNPSAWQKIIGLAELEIPTVALLHKPQSMLEEKLNFCKINKISILADPHCTYKEFGNRVGAESFRSWFTASPEIFYPRESERKYDIGFSGALHGSGKIEGPTRDLRTRIQAILKSNNSYNTFWNGSDSVTTRIKDVSEYSAKINECKIWLSTTGPMLDIGPRYFEVLLSKTLLFCNNMPKQYDGTFIDGENCVMFENDLSNFEEKLKYYLCNEDERNLVATRGYNMAKDEYTWKHMAMKLLDEVRKVGNTK
tara:strand:- start:13932 stop:14891 length:960 start_codon:yes stop_codon:yes gene_type:complete